jgi:hypothetical protein
MDKQLKQKWIKALRSGQYQKTSGDLHDGERFCALGVLCDVQGAEWQIRNDGYTYYPKGCRIPLKRLLPNKYRDGLDAETEMRIAVMNDHYRQNNFSMIADYIEKNL